MNEYELGTLRQTLETLSQEELLAMVWRLVENNTEVQQAVLKTVKIPKQVLAQQTHNPQQIKALQEEMDSFIKVIKNWDYGYDDESDEYDALDLILQKAKLLHPQDQIVIYRYMLTKAEKQLFTDMPIGTMNLEDALRVYGEAVREVRISFEDKKAHVDWLFQVFDWEMNNYGEITNAVKEAINHFVIEPEDYTYLLELLKEREEDDWIARCYLGLRDDEKYLALRLQRLITEDHFFELANFWQRKGDEKKYLQTLESWLTKLEQEKDASEDSHGGILQRLLEMYTKEKDDVNILRILLAKAKHTWTSLELYKQIENVAKRLCNWEETKKTFLQLADHNTTTKAEVYLYEKDYQAALALAKDKTTYRSDKELVVEGINDKYPQEAIEIYKPLVQEYIKRKKRSAYQEAAGYAGKIKSIYESILHDPKAWQKYINEIRFSYSNLPALQGELKQL